MDILSWRGVSVVRNVIMCSTWDQVLVKSGSSIFCPVNTLSNVIRNTGKKGP